MNRRSLMLSSLAAAAIGTVALVAGVGPADRGMASIAASAPALVTSSLAAETMKLDQAHTSLVFRVMHMNTSWVYGSFADLSGSMSWDDADAAKSSLSITVKTTSVNTGQPKRDEHLRNADFFLSAEFPEATFASKSFTKTGDKTWDVKGTLTVRGKAEDVTVKLEKTGESNTPRGNKVGFHATFVMDRMAHGISYGPDALGKNVEFMAGLQFNK